ncbi:MAG: TetR/AcrR family transcriptional regulator [bacterium]|nr:TetR/AcrR family transcriptional regulator [bacterium]
MPTYQKPPTVNDDARAVDIYREAARIISEKGFDATSMGDIAETVDLTKGGLYYYIKGKKALLYAIMNFVLNLLEDDVISIAGEEGDPDQRLASLLSGYVRLVIDEPSAMNILVNEEEGLDASYRPKIMERKRAFTDFLRESIVGVLERQQRTPMLDPTVAAHSVLGMVHGVVLWYKTDSDLGPDELVDQVTQLALRGLIADPPATPDPKVTRTDVERSRPRGKKRQVA